MPGSATAQVRAFLQAHLASKGDQSAFARQMGYTPPWISMILAGKRQIRLDDLDKVAAYFNVPLTALFQEGHVLVRHGRDIQPGHAAETRVLEQRLAAMRAEIRDVAKRLVVLAGPASRPVAESQPANRTRPGRGARRRVVNQ